MWAFLSQVLDSDQSCRKAVSRIVGYCVQIGISPPSPRTGAYCRARQKLSETLLRNLFLKSSQVSKDEIKKKHLWFGREVKIVDGTCVSMPDTPENQEQYPQSPRQTQGCGFPLAQMVGLFSLATGAILDVAFSISSKGENILFYDLWKHLISGDVLLADRGFCSFSNAFFLKEKGVDVIFRLHQKRKSKHYKKISRNDSLVVWKRNHARWKNFPKKLFDRLPKEMILREICVNATCPGFRTQKLILVTTILDPKKFPKDALSDLYQKRWMCEVSFRDLKITMQMDILRSKTPEMVRKEVYAHLIAYNLIRTLMLKASVKYKKDPLQLSFKGTLQHLQSFLPLMSTSNTKTKKQLRKHLLYTISCENLPCRPDRIEPRLMKRRPKNYGWLQMPRNKLKKFIIKNPTTAVRGLK